MSLTVKKETNLQKCERLWKNFSPDETLFDLWEMRHASLLAYKFSPCFYTVFQNEKPVAFLPLWYNGEEKIYEFVGGFFPEENSFFCNKKELIGEIVEIVPKPALLLGISPQRMPQGFDQSPFCSDEPKYISYLNGEKTVDQFLQRVRKKARFNLKYAYKKISNLEPETFWVKDVEEYKKYMKNLRAFSVERFKDAAEPSSFEDDRECDAFINLYKLQGRYEMGMVVVKVNKRVVAADLVAFYKNCAYLLTGASDLTRYPGIGSYIFYVELEKSLKRGVDAIDCLQYDYGWKHRYFDSQPMLKLEKQ